MIINPFWGGPVTDPSFSNVVLLLHGDGTNGSTTFTDSSSLAKSVSAIGSGVVLTTAQFKFGTASIDGSPTTGGLSVPSSTDWDFTTTVNYTAEAWIRRTGTTGSAVPGFIFARADANNQRGWRLGYVGDVGNRFIFYYSTNGVSETSLSWGTSSDDLPLNTWAHLALVVNNGILALYINGVALALFGGSTTLSGTPFSPSTALKIGCWTNGGGPLQFMPAQFDDIRFTKGVARYTSNFTPPTAAFPNS